MIDRKGDVRTFWLFGILAVVILVIMLTGVWQKIGFLVYASKLLPSFNNTPSEGTSIVGINLAKNELMYYTGEKWRKIDYKEGKKDKFFMGSYEFVSEDIKKDIENFYLNTPRKPEKFNLEINHWRYWDVVNQMDDRGIIIQPRVKNGFVGTDYDGSFLVLNSLDSVKESPFQVVIQRDPRVLAPGFAKIEYDKYLNKVAQVILWRDSILEGNKCEKFLSLKIKDGNVDEPKLYTVRKVDNYLFVDLSKTVYSGKTQEYDKDNCLEIEDYRDIEDRRDWVNDASISFEYSYKRFFNHIQHERVSWSQNRWNYDSDIEVYKVLSGKGIYEGLILLTKSGGIFEQREIIFDKSKGNDVVVRNFENGIQKSLKVIDAPIYGKKGSYSESVNSFLYNILDEYNKHFKPLVVEKKINE